MKVPKPAPKELPKEVPKELPKAVPDDKENEDPATAQAQRDALSALAPPKRKISKSAGAAGAKRYAWVWGERPPRLAEDRVWPGISCGVCRGGSLRTDVERCCLRDSRPHTCWPGAAPADPPPRGRGTCCWSPAPAAACARGCSGPLRRS